MNFSAPKSPAKFLVPFAYATGIGTILLAIYFLCYVVADYKGLLEISYVMIFIGVLMVTAATLTKNHPKDER
jgi:hypothetical protein